MLSVFVEEISSIFFVFHKRDYNCERKTVKLEKSLINDKHSRSRYDLGIVKICLIISSRHNRNTGLYQNRQALGLKA
jgi:hypothetical protein